ncbi:DNA-binding transcriptional regulator, GntR family [Pseudoxanthobacter soli DSM 19599]|uniref:DNA-binding transcriptional regulator, GntR family n=1 Tax=Pseudoxanthobacter soli DSM 19599 TaxID=1123029 RepID=A0A1M7ZL82_9HYPH|nr:GntR family transcriptional regulator [Pseudoxanthobacter soli]SHO65569.1 DNA-binding transcriptional regulator, GntR family [Pseudoxanthobacter soli DSM 19599]
MKQAYPRDGETEGDPGRRRSSRLLRASPRGRAGPVSGDTQEQGFSLDGIAVDPSLPEEDRLYAAIRDGLSAGRLMPGQGIGIRTLAEAFGIGPGAAREAARRLAAEDAVLLTDSRIEVPPLSLDCFEELMQARLLLEPACAVRAMPYVDRGLLGRVHDYDAVARRAAISGDAEIGMMANHRFHFEIYRAAPSHVLVPLVERIWMRFGPFMRAVYGMAGTPEPPLQHAAIIAAIKRRDPEALKASVAEDIRSGLSVFDSAMSARR